MSTTSSRSSRCAGFSLPGTAPQRHHLAAVRTIAQRIAGSADLSNLLDEALAALDDCLGIRHAMILMADARARKLYTVASRGYQASGVGSEIAFGEGVIGVAAREITPIRIMHRAAGVGLWPGDPGQRRRRGTRGTARNRDPGSRAARFAQQLAVPVVAGSALSAILYVEDVLDRRFGFDDEDALVAVAALLGPTIRGMQELAESAADPGPAHGDAPLTQGAPLLIRHYDVDDSVFLGDDYLIKGVAGRIFCSFCVTTRGTDARSSATASCASTRRFACRTSPTTWKRGSFCCNADWPSAPRFCRWRSRDEAASAFACAGRSNWST